MTGATPASPASWNGYTYVQGDPVNLNDATGRFFCSAEFSYEQCGGDAWFWGGRGTKDGEGDGDITFFPCPAGPGFVRIPSPFCYSTIVVIPPPPPKPLECEADLYYRPVDDVRARIVGATHTYWEVEIYDPNSKLFIEHDIISAGPDNTNTYLNVWVHLPNEGPDTPRNGTWWWGTGLSPDNCPGVHAMLLLAERWPQNTIRYGAVDGPNSNSVAALLARAASFSPPPSQPPGAEWGWRYWVP
jgi:hypothetical protein